MAQLDRDPSLWRGSLPREVLVDVSTLEPDGWASWVSRFSPAGDTTVTIGWKEDPLAHPRWKEFLSGSAYGLNLRTTG